MPSFFGHFLVSEFFQQPRLLTATIGKQHETRKDFPFTAFLRTLHWLLSEQGRLDSVFTKTLGSFGRFDT